ncbi:MAG: ATP-dependent DNA helicase [Actinomycetaceae bacterium]|nr:ATP-dependent DNA helicase [Actinomycetaceae bacterium]MDY6083019.1 ATP-dependent DNA helicase [Actinomycetaceae bacterium]
MAETLDAERLLHHIIVTAGGEDRPGQAEMVRAVEHALTNDEHIIVQAGTGTGKSLGYLVPAAAWVAQSHQRVVVSTATLALQRQILMHDAPEVTDALRAAAGKDIHVAVLKGWQNYLCLRKTSDGVGSQEEALFSYDGQAVSSDSVVGRQVVQLREWAKHTLTGDRDDYPDTVSDRAWAQVSTSKRECVGSECPFAQSCFALTARERAADAQIVVTNHTLLGIQASGVPVLPEFDAVIVDEAHALADRVTGSLSALVSEGMISRIARGLRRMHVASLAVEKCATDVGEALEHAEEGRLKDYPPALASALMQTADSLSVAMDDLKKISAADDSQKARKKVVVAQVEALHDVIVDALSAPARDGAVVMWISQERMGRALHLAPLDVAGVLASTVFEEKPAILTSATAALGGSFSSLAAQVGFALSGADSWRGMDVGTPFEPAKQGILYIASRLPRPRGSGYGDECREEMLGLIEASAGGALGLFSSRQAVQKAADYVRTHSELPLLVQGEDQLSALIDDFRSDVHASLFGTLSLWQGVDVPGMTNRLVIIDRIPFPVPSDPLIAARSEAVKARGGNDFIEVSATRAALLLAQGAGRLLRKKTDRGVVAVLDSRLAGRSGYAVFLRRTLPRFWTTTDPAVVRGALEHLAADLPE